jgi:glyoxylase-like metal-dependent hydrolase (beta-lactamase superfamily II)
MNKSALTDKTIKLLDSVYVTEQTFDGVTVRGAIICGSQRVMIFDTLVFPQVTNELMSLCLGRELVVVYSHADWDHVWGTCGLQPSEIIAHEKCARRFVDPTDVEKTLKEYREKHTAELDTIQLMPPHRTFQSSLLLDLGGITVELHHCPGHTEDSIVAIVPERSLLLGADCIEKPIPLLNEGSENLLLWIKMLEELERDARITICVPSHGEIGVQDLIRHNIAYLKSLLSDEATPPPGLDTFYSSGHQDNRKATASLRR